MDFGDDFVKFYLKENPYYLSRVDPIKNCYLEFFPSCFNLVIVKNNTGKN